MLSLNTLENVEIWMRIILSVIAILLANVLVNKVEDVELLTQICISSITIRLVLCLASFFSSSTIMNNISIIITIIFALIIGIKFKSFIIAITSTYEVWIVSELAALLIKWCGLTLLAKVIDWAL